MEKKVHVSSTSGNGAVSRLTFAQVTINSGQSKQANKRLPAVTGEGMKGRNQEVQHLKEGNETA